MRTITLTENERAVGVELTASQRDEITRTTEGKFEIRHSPGTTDRYDLKARNVVGAVAMPGLAIEVRPKLPLESVLFVFSYALDPRRWHEQPFLQSSTDHLTEAFIHSFCRIVEQSTHRGLLTGYREHEEDAPVIRGRIRFADQLRARPGIWSPIAVGYEEFTDDIIENQLLRSALTRLRRLPMRSADSRRQLRRLSARFGAITARPFDARTLPDIHFTRLNSHYEDALALARLVLRSASLEVGHGSHAGTALLFDMAGVFETFVTVALREALGLSATVFPQNARGRRLHLDADEQLRLHPDLSWWRGDRCVFVGDIKYKRTTLEGATDADAYQLLAYATATGLDEGLLVYAAGEAPPGAHEISQAGKRIHVRTLDLAGSPEEILGRVSKLADFVRNLVEETSALAA